MLILCFRTYQILWPVMQIQVSGQTFLNSEPNLVFGATNYNF